MAKQANRGGRGTRTSTNARSKSEDATFQPMTDLTFCYFGGVSYSPGSFLKIEGAQDKYLYCNSGGTWDVKGKPS